MMRHILAEGWLLLRHHFLVSVILALALAVPLCLGGVTWVLGEWLQPLIDLTDQQSVVMILLHPEMDEGKREQWIQTQQEAHGDWQVRSVPPEQLADRLTQWFPYLVDVFEQDGGSFLPPLVEIETSDLISIDSLKSSPSVLAIGPRSSVNQVVGGAARRSAVLLAVLSAVLLASAAALAAVWVHLGVYRHGDEITIMRLIGATEMAIRGPFLLSVAVPGALSGVFSCIGTAVFAGFSVRLTEAFGLPPVAAGWQIFAFQCVIGFLLPLLTGMFTLSRHAYLATDS